MYFGETNPMEDITDKVAFVGDKDQALFLTYVQNIIGI